ncbi:MAG TPA: glycosyltransferase family 2 protein, partial [Anaerolineales bacterium]|nr:glycosyltransferase family 2 protein [Anaerolineales bacterium]
MPRFSIIIPNWNGARWLTPCLESLRSQTTADFEVIVVDNASRDESLALLAERYPEVRVVALDRNLGFTGACNAGFRVAQGEYQALLNNDTEVDPHWVAEVMAAFERHPKAGMIASRMLLFDRRDTFHTAGDIFKV